MKKIKYLFILLLIIPIFVIADSGGPIYVKTSVIVTNPNGAALYEIDDDEYKLIQAKKHLEFQENIEISYYEEFNGVNYGHYEYCTYDYEDDEENCESYYVNMNNLSTKKDEFTLNDLNNYISNTGFEESDEEEHVKNIYIYNEGIKLKKGPSTLYNYYDYTINVGEIYEVRASVDGWYYISNGKNEGWLDNSSETSMIGYAIDYGDKIWILKDSSAYSLPSKDSKLDYLTVPKDTKFNQAFYVSDENDNGYYVVSYNGQYVFLLEDSIAEEYNPFYIDYWTITKNAITVDKVKGYKNFDDVKANITIDSSTEFEILYETKLRYYIKYENKYAWIQNVSVIGFSTTDEFLTISDLKLFNKYEGKEVLSVPNGTKLSVVYDLRDIDETESSEEKPDWYAVKYNGKIYWVNSEQEYAEGIGESEEDDSEDYITLETKKIIYDNVSGNITNDYFDKNEKVKPIYYYIKEITDEKIAANDTINCDTYGDGMYCEELWYYVSNGEKSGWIYAESGEKKEVLKYIETLETEKKEIENNGTISEPDVIEISTENKKLTKKETIYIYSIGSIFLALVCIATILLINKNKKNKESNKVVNSIENNTEVNELEKSIEETVKEDNNLNGNIDNVDENKHEEIKDENK